MADKKKKFSDAVMGVQYFDTGGSVVTQTPSPSTQSGGDVNKQGSAASFPGWIASGVTNPIASAGGSAQGIAGAFTAQNQYQAQLAPQQQSDYSGLMGQASGNSLSGFGSGQNIQAQQQALANAFQQQSLGQGPNPAQAALAQNTGQNINQQAALMAGQRGAGANAGLVGRQAAMQGAGIQQNAVGQAATLQAQQSLAAQQALMRQQEIMGGQNIAQQGASNQLFGLGVGGQNAQNAANISNYGMAQGINAQTAQNNANAVNKNTAGVMNGAGSILSMLAYDGGMVPEQKYASGGGVDQMGSYQTPNLMQDQSWNGTVFPSIGSMLGGKNSQEVEGGGAGGSSGGGGGGMPAMDDSKNMPMYHGGPASNVGHYLKHGKMRGQEGSVPAMVSPGEVYLKPEQVQQVEHGADPISVGEKIPGTPKVKGNSPKNDTVHKNLDPGGIVLPNEVLQSKDPHKKAHEFVSAVLAKHGIARKK